MTDKALATIEGAGDILEQVVIVGDRADPASQDLLRGVFATSLPNRILTIVGPNDALPANHPASGKGQTDGKATAYVCVGTTCSLPLTDRSALVEAL